ncbi:MAG: TRAP transporter substrate-binding protein [Rhodobacteraceae bacterium]|nr:TRAP transporter substrate-binding protein [Paracoccaceae bacterium]
MNFNLNRRAVLGGAAALAGVGALPHAARANTVLRYGNAGGPGTGSNVFNQKLSDLISERTGGSLSFEIFAGTLGGEQELIQSMALGSLDVYNGAYTGTDEFDIFYSPHFFRDGEHARAVIESEIGTLASQALEDQYRARLLGVGRLGSFNLMLNEPIESLADLRGRKIRAPQIRGCIEGLEFFGAIPTPIPFNEVYLSLQSGIVDGVLTALNPGVQFKFYEVARFVVVPDFGLALDKQAISLSAWNGLTDEEQEILQTSFDELEEEEYFKRGVAQKAVDLEAWAAANGAEALIDFDASELVGMLEPLNRRLAEEVFGEGAWDTITSA